MTTKPPISSWLARAAIVFALAATVVAWIMIGRLAGTVEETADAAEQGALLGVEGASNAAILSDDLVALSSAVEEGIGQLDEVVARTSEIAVEVADASDGSAATAIATSIDALGDLAQLSDALAELSTALAVLGVPDPGANALAESLRAGAADLEPIPADLREIARQLRSGSASLTSLRANLERVESELATLTDDLRLTSASLAGVPDRVEEARQDVSALRADAGTNATWWRLILVLVAAAFIAACLGLDRLGRHAAARDRRERSLQQAPVG